MKRKRLSGKEIKKLNSDLAEKYGLDSFVNRKGKIEILDKVVISIDEKPCFFYYEDEIVPTLKFLLNSVVLPKVEVDMPAVKFMVNGANVMRPGITALDSFEKGDFVVIVDQTHNKPLAVGKAVFSSLDIENMAKGKVILNIHHIGDNIWDDYS